MSTKFILRYHPADVSQERLLEHLDAHQAHAGSAAAAGELLSFGPFADLPTHGSLGIFTTQEAADRFIAGDPFVINGIIATHEVREWTDVLS